MRVRISPAPMIYEGPRPEEVDDVRRLVDLAKCGVIWATTSSGHRLTADKFGVSFSGPSFTFLWEELEANRPELWRFVAMIGDQIWHTSDGWKDAIDALADLAE